MLEYLLQVFNNFKIINFILAPIFFYVLYFFVLKVWSGNKIWLSKTLLYKGKQRVHEGEIPRLGGLIIFLFLIIYAFFIANPLFNNTFLKSILICIVPMMIVTVKEDLMHNVDYRLRLFGLILSAAGLLLFAINSLPVVNHIILISDLFNNPAFSFAFFTLCLIALANGCNFIDGMNGLLGFYLLGAMMCCMELSFIAQDYYISAPVMLFSFLTLLFLLVNYPWGKLFIGDSGAYLMALLIGAWTINFFSTYESISSWNAGLIFFYPIIEVTYSIIRKLYQKKSPFHPDREHLHLKIFDILNTAMNKPRLANNLTTVFLAIFWLAPPLILPWVYDSQLMISISIIILILTYIVLNKVIPARTQY